MLQVAIIYDSGKRYIFPIEIIEKYVDKEILDKIKAELIKEIQKL